MTTEWVDFKAIKAAVTVQMVLDHYGIKGLISTGDELRGPCPIHKGSQRTKTFTVNLSKNAFKCFNDACNAKGNVLDLVSAMEKCSVREAGIKLQQWFKVGESENSSSERDKGDDNLYELSRGIYTDQEGAMFELIATATDKRDSQRLVVYRELFGDYSFWVAPTDLFSAAAKSLPPGQFTRVKPL